MRFINPLEITDDKLLSSNVAETDYPAWGVGTTYAAGARVISAHRIYESLAAGNVGNMPADSPLSWVNVAPTNRWAMFDRAVGTLTTKTGGIVVDIYPGAGINSIALLDVAADTVLVQQLEGAGEVYSNTVVMQSNSSIGNWFDYFFSPFLQRTTLVLNDLISSSTALLRVTISGAGAVSVGTLVVGNVVDVGDTQHGASLGIIDYSVKKTDPFGATDVVRRGYAKRFTARVALSTNYVDLVARRLTDVRAVPVVWIGAPGFDEAVVYGYYKDWSIDISYPTLSYCSLTIEGMV